MTVIQLQLITVYQSNCRPSIGLAVLFLLQIRFFCPATAKSHMIWIKICTHLLLYGIHLWADLDRDGTWVAPDQTRMTYVFSVILVTYPQSYIETTDRRDLLEARTGAIVKNSGIL